MKRPRPGLLATLLIAAVAGCAVSPPRPAASATPEPSVSRPSASETSPSPIAVPPLSLTFRSPTMGYSVRYPNGWTVFEATTTWNAGDPEFWDTPNGDRIESTVAGFRGGSQKLQPGQAAAAWIKAYIGDDDPNCGPTEQLLLGGAVASIGLNGCAGRGRLGGRVFDLVVGIGDRVYNFTMEGEVDRGFLDAMLATVTFEPASAVDRP